MDAKKIKELFNKNGLSRFWNIMESQIKNGISISLEKKHEDSVPIGQSKIGGFPDLPKEIEWFRFKDKPMSFLAQINLTEIKPFDLDDKLPNEGILYFFYDAEQETWGFDPKDRGCSKVYFYEGNLENLERKKRPEELEDYQYYYSCKLNYQSTVNLPNYFSSLMDGIELTDEESEKYFQIIEEVNQEEVINKILGHSDNVQGGMELECELVTNGLYCGDESGYNDPKTTELAKNVDLWNLLFQIDSNEEDAGMMWGDCGRLYFWIKEEDLREKRFENAWLILQCC
ncbi:MAG: YwqG family protein [Flavobacterium sp.]